jgi:hypothetical protein
MEAERTCRSCGTEYRRADDPDDPLCPACREQVAAWHEDKRLTALAQQGFEEALGMRPPSGAYPGLPADAGLRARRWGAGAAMGPQQLTPGQLDGGALAGEPDYIIVPGQVRCRHCAAVLDPGPDGTWTAAPDGGTSCFAPGVTHDPLPGGLDGSPA